MKITKDHLIERRRQLEADSIAISGAIQMVDWCLDKLEEEDPTGAETLQEMGSEEGA